jgi:hypothetical protein
MRKAMSVSSRIWKKRRTVSLAISVSLDSLE